MEPDHVKLPELQKKLAVAIAHAKEVARRKEQAAAAQKLARIEELLVAAKVDEQAGRIRTPFGNNALEKYQQVLDLDPDQVVAVHKLIEYGR